MKPEDYAKKHFVIEGIGGIEVTPEYRNPDYELRDVKPDAITNEKGYLPLFRIVPKRPGLPAFVARVGHDDQNAVDIQLAGEKAERKRFATGASGYVGHRTQRLSTDLPTFKIDIQVPSAGRVFAGTITIKTAGLGVRLNDSC